MAVNTYVAIDTKTLSNDAAITFTSIPQTFTDLVLVLGSLTFSSGGNPQIQFNGDTATNYSNTDMYGNGTSALSTRNSNNNYINVGFSSTNGSATEPSTVIVQIANYTSTVTNKSTIARGNRAGGEVQANIGLWRGTPAAINSITVKVASGSMSGTATLYGIAATSVGAKATGGVITSDSSYFYHTFTSTGAFVPTQSITADVLVVAGGGGGGGSYAGGGGGGGLLAFASQSLSATNYTCTVGAGGNGGAQGVIGGTGVDSQFGALTLVKGGGGGGHGAGTSSNSGGNGGSGGGAGRGAFSPFSASGGSPTSGQGNAGGSYVNATAGNVGCGGGGAGAVGGSQSVAVPSSGGIGGIGSSEYSSWGAVTGVGQLVSGVYYLAGGGGGGAFSAETGGSGAGGLGGGAAGGYGVSGSSAIVNTGGGGGGGGGNTSYAGGNGGSGIVIVRYAR